MATIPNLTGLVFILEMFHYPKYRYCYPYQVRKQPPASLNPGGGKVSDFENFWSWAFAETNLPSFPHVLFYWKAEAIILKVGTHNSDQKKDNLPIKVWMVMPSLFADVVIYFHLLQRFPEKASTF